MSRKTIKIEELKSYVNYQLMNTTADQVEVRKALMALIEQMLYDVGSYNGFSYLVVGDVKDGLPGIHYGNDGSLLPFPERFENTDPTRVKYH